MQAEELERNQDLPSPAQGVRRQRAYSPNRTNTRTAHGLYDLGCWRGTQDRLNVNLTTTDTIQNHKHFPMYVLTSSHVVNKSAYQNQDNTDDFPDHLFFQREVYFFLFSQRTILAIYWGKMATSSGLYLNEREIETISYLAAGYGAKEIARELNLSPRTVEHRIETLKRRLGARNVTHLIAMVLLAKPVQASVVSDSGGE